MNKPSNFAFSGVFIPRHIWVNPHLCCLDKVVWATIDVLHDGLKICTATDSEIADILGENEMSVAASVLKMCKLGILNSGTGEVGGRDLWTVELVFVEKEPKDEEEKASVADVQRIVDIYNDTCKSLPRAEKLTPTRVARIRRLMKEYKDDAAWSYLFLRVQNSEFLSGRTGRWTGCNLDWILSPSNLTKVTEGIYDNRSASAPQIIHLPENLR